MTILSAHMTEVVTRRIDTVCMEVTLRCPLRCVHCSAHASPERGEHLSVSIYLALLDRLGPLEELYISGGEPFEHPQLNELLAASRARKTIVYSSGVRNDGGRVAGLRPEHLSRILGLVDRIDLSLFSHLPVKHDAVTQTPGSFSALMESLGHLRTSGVAFGIHYVPLVDRGADVLEVARLARESGAARFHVLAVSPQGRAHRWPLGFDPQFLGAVDRIQEEPGFAVLLSSSLRQALGRQSTPRDSWSAAFIDVRGQMHASEGRRRLKVMEGTSNIDIAQELGSLSS